MRENCDNCSKDYELSKANTALNLYIEDPACNHAAATCPHCGAVERIYATADSFLHIMSEIQVGLSLHPRADDELKSRAAKTWETVTPDAAKEDEAVDELPDLPSQVRRELYDDFRNWKGVME